MPVSEVLSLAKDGLNVMAIDAKRYQDRLAKLEEELRTEQVRKEPYDKHQRSVGVSSQEPTGRDDGMKSLIH